MQALEFVSGCARGGHSIGGCFFCQEKKQGGRDQLCREVEVETALAGAGMKIGMKEMVVVHRVRVAGPEHSSACDLRGVDENSCG